MLSMPFVLFLHLLNWRNSFDIYSILYVGSVSLSCVLLFLIPAIQLSEFSQTKVLMEHYLDSLPDIALERNDGRFMYSPGSYNEVVLPKSLGYIYAIRAYKSGKHIRAYFFFNAGRFSRAYWYYDSDDNIHVPYLNRLDTNWYWGLPH
jgi:hypothetical protein